MDSDASTALRELRDMYRSAEDKADLKIALGVTCRALPDDTADMLLVCLEQLEVCDDVVTKSEAFIAQVKVEREQFDAERRAWEIERDRLQSLYKWAQEDRERHA